MSDKPTEAEQRFTALAETLQSTPGVTSDFRNAGASPLEALLKTNGKLFATFGRGKLALRLPQRRALEIRCATVFERGDPCSQVWLVFDRVSDIELDWLALARESMAFVASLDQEWPPRT